jgi:hypothetical protein
MPYVAHRPDEYDRWRREERQGYLSQMNAWEQEKLRFDGFSDCKMALDFSLISVSWKNLNFIAGWISNLAVIE